MVIERLTTLLIRHGKVQVLNGSSPLFAGSYYKNEMNTSLKAKLAKMIGDFVHKTGDSYLKL